MPRVLRFGEWLRQAETKGPDPATFLCGPESLFRDQILRRIKEQIFGDAAQSGLAHDRFYGGEGPLSQVTVALASVGLFAATRLVSLAEAEKAGKANAADRKELLSALKRGTPGSVFVAASDLSVADLEKKSDWTRGLLGCCQIVEVAHPTPVDALKWIMGEGARRGISLSAEAGAYLISACTRAGAWGGADQVDLQELCRELEKLELATAPGEKIGLDGVREMMRRGQLGSISEFCRAILDGQTRSALRLRETVGRLEPTMRIQWALQSEARRRISRPARGKAQGSNLDLVLEQAYALERGIKTGGILPGSEQNALDFLVVSAGPEAMRVGRSGQERDSRRK